VLFRGDGARLAFEPEDGLEVLVLADVTIYSERGDLQLVARHLEPRGRGALTLAFEQLRARLEAEGLFDPARKRGLPRLPRAIGVATSLQAAALRDVLEVTGARLPGVRLVLAPARVQGDGAEHEVAAAIAALGQVDEVDVILVVRGGGSLEDLWTFNTEVVARAITAARVPVVTGIGHEVDLTIADLAADLRAPTPSAAAARVLPHRDELRQWVDARRRALERAFAGRRAAWLSRVEVASARLARASPAARLAAQRQSHAAALRRLTGAAELAVERRRARLAGAAGRLDVLSPLGVLGRGYAIARRLADGRILRDAAEVAAGDRVSIRLARGEIEASVRATGSESDPKPS
jgi:exodeoxyribonuclease VII large subunit